MSEDKRDSNLTSRKLEKRMNAADIYKNQWWVIFLTVLYLDANLEEGVTWTWSARMLCVLALRLVLVPTAMCIIIDKSSYM